VNKLLQLAKTNLAMLFNAASLVGTTAVTSVLGFAFWWVVGKSFPKATAGLATDLISAMTFLGTLAMLGFGTLLTGELPRQPGKEWSLINGALIVVGGTGVVAGILFAFLAPFISPELATIGKTLPNMALFSLGVGFTALTLVLDQALIGIMRGGLQLWRNALFAVIKLIALVAGIFIAAPEASMIIYVSWLLGNVLSLSVLFFAQKSRAPALGTEEKMSPVSGPLVIEKSIKLPCPDCGTLSSNSASFCLKCGYPFSPTLAMRSVRPRLLFDYGVIGLQEMPTPGKRKQSTGNFCPDCKHVSPDRAHFCTFCGYPLTPTVEVASVKMSAVSPVRKVRKTTLPLQSRVTIPLPASRLENSQLPATFEKARLALAVDSSEFFLENLQDESAGTEIRHTPLPGQIEHTLPPSTEVQTPRPLAGEQATSPKEAKNNYLPQWDLLRKLGGAAIQHHILNLILLAPSQILPILVTVLISTEATAQFYFSFMMANFIFALTYALSTVLYAVGAARPDLLAQKIRFTLGLSFITSLGANLVLQFAAGLLLSAFGYEYGQSEWCLRILSLIVFPLIIKSHFLAICRVQERISQVILPIAAGSLIELIGAAIGAHFGGLVGVSLGWFTVIVFEALYMSRTVLRAAYPVNINTMVSKKTAKA
jgi:O-antigen/teichoic acid export membrane protein